ncbi:MAG: ATP-dependent DNA helicase [Acidobacteria bacterium]|nr:ATP-dependent DNA helicase [Acidobacteriota bacterium]MDW7984345.1 ATP-dependent DNA helicase [Acidobacteriota bacterium]
MEAWFGPEGRLRESLSEFEFRPGQLQMAQAVAQGLAEGRWVIVEAGTGIGKTLAYLVPAVVGSHPLLVATGTIALQEQLARKDIPLLARCGLRVSAAVLKGRSHYLCLWKWNRWRRAPPLVLDASLAHRLEAWVRQTSTGDPAEFDGLPEDHPLWTELTADAQTCMGSRCAFFRDCYLYEARRQAERAQVVIVNHHLLLADARVRTHRDRRLLPDVPHLVIDEAHMLEETAVSTLTLTLSFVDFYRLLQELDTSIQVSERMPDASLRQWQAYQNRIRTEALALFGREANGGSQMADREQANSERRPDSLMCHSPFAPTRVPWSEFCRLHTGLDRHLINLKTALQGLITWVQVLPLPEEERDQFSLWASELATLCDVFAENVGDDLVRYAELSGATSYRVNAPRWTLCAAPLQVGPLLAEWLWPRFRSVVLTSATLTYRGRFDFLAERLGLAVEDRRLETGDGPSVSGPSLVSLSIPSPFQWRQQTCLWIPSDMPDPRDPAFVPELQRRVEALVRLVGGSTLVLCTSVQNMQTVAAYLEERVPWTVYQQGRLPRRLLMERFQADVSSVLVATAGFWQGFDVPGEALRCVIIDKLPFEVPSDPVVQARIESIRRAGQDPFHVYQLPKAITLLRQGLGRLIRTRTDTGLMALMDSRVWRRPYGRIILRELRPIPIVRAWEELKRWWHERNPVTSQE